MKIIIPRKLLNRILQYSPITATIEDITDAKDQIKHIDIAAIGAPGAVD